MKKPTFDIKKRPQTNRHNNATVEDFSIDKLKQYSEEIIELFKLIQAVRIDRIALQEEYNESRLKLNNDRMNLESEVVKMKKQYSAKISALQEEYNSVKSGSIIELAKIRES